MNARTKRRAIGFEAMESRSLLSAGLAGPAAVHVEKIRASAKAAQGLSGTIKGQYTISSLSAAGIGSAQLSGAGTVKPLGHVHATGTPLGVNNGEAQIELVLTNAKGTVNVGLSAPVPGGPVKKIKATAMLEGGTGAYASATGSGLATITVGKMASGGLSGAFTLTLKTKGGPI